MNEKKKWWKNRPYWQKGILIILFLTLIFSLIFGLETILWFYIILLPTFLGAILTLFIISSLIYLFILYTKRNKKVRRFTKIWIVFLIIYLLIGVIFYTYGFIKEDNFRPIENLMVIPIWGVFCVWLTLLVISCNIKGNCTQLGL